MAATAEEFLEVLQDENRVDLVKLREMATHGIPDFDRSSSNGGGGNSMNTTGTRKANMKKQVVDFHLRGHVWKYLLGTSDPDRDAEAVNSKELAADYSSYERTSLEVSLQLKATLSEFAATHSSVFHDADVRQMALNVITIFLNYHDMEFSPNLVYLCGPLADVVVSESDLYFLFSTLLNRLGQVDESLFVGQFTSLFRVLNGALYSHFEDEELVTSQWIGSWFRSLLARQLPIHCVQRLWDTYLAQPDGLNLHIYVCLAILEKCKEDLEELDHESLRLYLVSLPEMDMTEILVSANNIRNIAHELI